MTLLYCPINFLVLALGAAALLAGILILTGLIEADLVFSLAVLAGLVLAAARTATTLLRHRNQGRPEPGT